MYLLTKVAESKGLNSIFNQIYLSTPKRIQDRSIVSSIKPKFDNHFLLVYVFCMHCEREIVFALIFKTDTTISGSQFVQNTSMNKELE